MGPQEDYFPTSGLRPDLQKAVRAVEPGPADELDEEIHCDLEQ